MAAGAPAHAPRQYRGGTSTALRRPSSRRSGSTSEARARASDASAGRATQSRRATLAAWRADSSIVDLALRLPTQLGLCRVHVDARAPGARPRTPARLCDHGPASGAQTCASLARQRVCDEPMVTQRSRSSPCSRVEHRARIRMAVSAEPCDFGRIPVAQEPGLGATNHRDTNGHTGDLARHSKQTSSAWPMVTVMQAHKLVRTRKGCRTQREAHDDRRFRLAERTARMAASRSPSQAASNWRAAVGTLGTVETRIAGFSGDVAR